MTDDAYRTALEEVRKDLTNAIRQFDHWTVEVARLQQLNKGLAASLKKPAEQTAVPDKVGFTDLVQSIVRSSFKEMTAVDVRDSLEESGYDLAQYANPLALIHQSLKRLAKDLRIDARGRGKYRASEPEWSLMQTSPALKAIEALKQQGKFKK